MVRIALSPPVNPPDPIFYVLPAGINLFRLFDPSRYNTTATSFRYFGPLLRFDHHRLLRYPSPPTPSVAPNTDAERGIYYAGFTLSCCIVEVFGDSGLIDCDEWRVAIPRLTRDVRLLELRGRGAMRAGSVAALGKMPDHVFAQTWSRYFYDTPVYQQPEGLVWYNAHNDEAAVALYERAQDALDCPQDRIIRLDDRVLRPVLEQIAAENNLVCVP